MKNLQLRVIAMIAVMGLMGNLLISCSEDSVTGPKIPVVTSISPDSVEPGDDITITGTDLDGALEVTFNNVAGTIVSNTATQVVATVPEGATSGKVAVKTAGGLGISSADLTVVIVGAVSVTSVSPRSAKVGESVVISGVDFATVFSVKVGDKAASIVGTPTETSVTITIPDGVSLGKNTFTIENSCCPNTTTTEDVVFYVYNSLPELSMTFDGDNAGVFTGSLDPEESTIFGTSDDATVMSSSKKLPEAIDGNFFHFEGFSSTTFSGNYATIVANSGALPAGTYAEFLSGGTDQTIYFNIQIHLGELPVDYADALFGLRLRFDGGDYEWIPTPAELAELGIEADAKGWYNISVPASIFDDGKAAGTYAYTDLQRIAVAVRRNYGTGGTAGVQVTEADGGIFYTQSFDNAIITVGGPYSFKN